MRMMDPPRDAPGLRPQDADAPPRRGALDRALARLETLFEVGASALVPLATIAFPWSVSTLYAIIYNAGLVRARRSAA